MHCCAERTRPLRSPPRSKLRSAPPRRPRSRRAHSQWTRVRRRRSLRSPGAAPTPAAAGWTARDLHREALARQRPVDAAGGLDSHRSRAFRRAPGPRWQRRSLVRRLRAGIARVRAPQWSRVAGDIHGPRRERRGVPARQRSVRIVQRQRRLRAVARRSHGGGAALRIHGRRRGARADSSRHDGWLVPVRDPAALSTAWRTPSIVATHCLRSAPPPGARSRAASTSMKYTRRLISSATSRCSRARSALPGIVAATARLRRNAPGCSRGRVGADLLNFVLFLIVSRQLRTARLWASTPTASPSRLRCIPRRRSASTSTASASTHAVPPTAALDCSLICSARRPASRRSPSSHSPPI